MNCHAAIFDLDGTLFDTFGEHHEAWAGVCAEHGVPLTREQFIWSFGRRNDEIIPALWRAAGRPAPSSQQLHSIAERKEVLFRERFVKSPRLMPGAADLLRSLREAGWKHGAGSSAPPANVAAFLASIPGGASSAAARLDSADPGTAPFDAVVSGADVTHGKPHPEVFLRAAERLGVPPACCVVFEDAPPGVEAARRAGMACVAIVSRGRTREALAGADLLIDDFTTVTAEWLRTLVKRNRCGPPSSAR